jgi:hypothetical protein
MGIIFPITFAFDVVHWQVDLGNTVLEEKPIPSSANKMLLKEWIVIIRTV